MPAGCVCCVPGSSHCTARSCQSPCLEVDAGAQRPAVALQQGAQRLQPLGSGGGKARLAAARRHLQAARSYAENGAPVRRSVWTFNLRGTLVTMCKERHAALRPQEL